MNLWLVCLLLSEEQFSGMVSFKPWWNSTYTFFALNGSRAKLLLDLLHPPWKVLLWIENRYNKEYDAITCLCHKRKTKIFSKTLPIYHLPSTMATTRASSRASRILSRRQLRREQQAAIASRAYNGRIKVGMKIVVHTNTIKNRLATVNIVEGSKYMIKMYDSDVVTWVSRRQFTALHPLMTGAPIDRNLLGF